MATGDFEFINFPLKNIFPESGLIKPVRILKRVFA